MMDIALSIRLSDFREHVDKKFERIEGAFDDIWDRVVSGTKYLQNMINGHDARRSPPNDDEIGNTPKRRRREE